MKRLLMLSLTLTCLCTKADNIYVRAGASGDGRDWSNALPDLPMTLQRGKTYYVASGTYTASHSYPNNFTTDSINSTTPVVIKKATVSDHGTGTGWNSSYGTGQAIWAPGMNFFWCGGYITFNGYSGDRASPYGFRFNLNVGDRAILLRSDGSVALSHMTFSYIEFAGPDDGVVEASRTEAQQTYGIFFWAGVLSAPYATVSYCYGHGMSNPFCVCNADNLLFEHNIAAWVSCSGGAHPDCLYITDCNDVIIRYNLFYEYAPEGIDSAGTCNNWKVYGNIAYNVINKSAATKFADLEAAGIYANHVYYNNTFVGIGNVFYVLNTSGFTVRNNLSYKAGFGNPSGTVDHNWTTGSDPFVNLSARDFHLVAATKGMPRNAGIALGREYATDFDGNTRGADGAWDIGAYEYAIASTNPTLFVFPTSIAFGPVAPGQSATNCFRVQNTGGGLLAGTAKLGAATNGFSVVSGGAYTLGRNQSQTVVVSYSPSGFGSDSQTVIFTGGGGQIATVTGQLLTSFPGSSFDSYAGMITAPFATNSGGYVSQNFESRVLDQSRIRQ